MEREIVLDAATISRINAMADIDPLQPVDSIMASRNQAARAELAKLVLTKGCQALNTVELCSGCRALDINPPMCQRRNATMVGDE